MKDKNRKPKEKKNVPELTENKEEANYPDDQKLNNIEKYIVDNGSEKNLKVKEDGHRVIQDEKYENSLFKRLKRLRKKNRKTKESKNFQH